VAETLHLETGSRTSDLVITGEGRIDGQTLEGKGPAGVAALARKHRKPVLAFAGSITENALWVPSSTALCVIIDERFLSKPPWLAGRISGA